MKSWHKRTVKQKPGQHPLFPPCPPPPSVPVRSAWSLRWWHWGDSLISGDSCCVRGQCGTTGGEKKGRRTPARAQLVLEEEFVFSASCLSHWAWQGEKLCCCVPGLAAVPCFPELPCVSVLPASCKVMAPKASLPIAGPVAEEEQSSTTGDSTARRGARRCEANTGENKMTSNWGRDGSSRGKKDKWGHGDVK